MVENRVRGKVVHFDVVHVDGARHARGLIHVLDVVVQIGVLADHLGVGLEVHNVYLVEANEGHEQPHIRERHLAPGDVALLGENRLGAVQPLEKIPHGLLVGPLRRGESAPVHPVIYARIYPLVHLRLRRHHLRGVEIQLRDFRELVEGAVKHDDNVRRLVADDGLGLLVPQDGHGVLALGVARHLVQCAHVRGPVDRVGNGALAAEGSVPFHRCAGGVGRVAEDPATVLVLPGAGLLPRGVDDGHPDTVLEPLHGTHRQAPVRPRTRVCDVQVIAPIFGGEVLALADPATPHAIPPDKGAGIGVLLIERGASA
mmetsp:Transcript_59628/g.189740  ORF Transcript_59628/g.189740 Transcript_59628/m.189740 type:complete len:314 (-) Transcript_59628:238-1179(-)